MMLMWVFTAIAIISDALTCIYRNLVHGWQETWIAILLFAGYILAYLLLYLLVFLIISRVIDQKKPVEKQSRAFRWVMEETLSLVMTFCRVRIHTEGFELIPDRRFLLVSNHRSCFDPMVCLTAFRGKDVSFIAKPETFRLPWVGGIIHKCCFLPMDRDNTRRALQTVNAAAKLIKRGEVSIGIYPEGTRAKTGRLQEFHAGSFQIAKKADVPVIAVTVKNTELVAKRAPWRRTDVYIKIVGILDEDRISAMKTKEISEEVRRLMLCEID